MYIGRKCQSYFILSALTYLMKMFLCFFLISIHLLSKPISLIESSLFTVKEAHKSTQCTLQSWFYQAFQTARLQQNTQNTYLDKGRYISVASCYGKHQHSTFGEAQGSRLLADHNIIDSPNCSVKVYTAYNFGISKNAWSDFFLLIRHLSPTI